MDEYNSSFGETGQGSYNHTVAASSGMRRGRFPARPADSGVRSPISDPALRAPPQQRVAQHADHERPARTEPASRQLFAGKSERAGVQAGPDAGAIAAPRHSR